MPISNWKVVEGALTLYAGWRFIVRLNDNFSGLISHTFGLRGVKF